MSETTSGTKAKRQVGHPDTSTIFVLGLLGLSGAFIFSGSARYFGNRLLAKYDAEPGRYGARGWVVAGRIMGMIGLGVTALWLVVLVLGATTG
jgi:hypothetical protein